MQVDATLHLLPLCTHGIFIAGVNGWWSIVSRDSQWRHSNRYPGRNFQTNQTQLLIQEPSILPALSAGCFAETRFSIIWILGRIDKKKKNLVCARGNTLKKESVYDYLKIRNNFAKTLKSLEVPKNSERKKRNGEIEAIGYRKRFNGTICPSFFVVHPMHRPKYTATSTCLPSRWPSVLVTAGRQGERSAIKHCILHPAFCDGITHALVTNHR